MLKEYSSLTATGCVIYQSCHRKLTPRPKGVGVNNDPRLSLHDWRAQVTASVISSSVRFRLANFALTASARWILTGVRIICPFCTVTSKYSTEPISWVILFGSVNWFLDVNLASMIVNALQRNTESKEFLLCQYNWQGYFRDKVYPSELRCIFLNPTAIAQQKAPPIARECLPLSI